MSWRVVSLDEVQPQAWLNGGGVTRELLAWPGRGEWTVRASVAEVVQDGSFSELPGVRRWFAVLSGQGVRLRTGGAAHELRKGSPLLAFDGGSPTECQLLDGPTRDFNLMLRRGSVRIERLHGLCSRPCHAGAILAVYANEEPVSLACCSEALAVPPNTLAWRILDFDALVELSGADALWMEIEP